MTIGDAGVEDLDDDVGDQPDRHRDERDVGAGRGVPMALAATRPTAPSSSARAQPVAVAVEPDDFVAQLREREPDRSADQARPDDGDAHAALLGEVVAQRARLEVHVVQVVARLLAVEVHHHPDRPLHAVRDAELTAHRSAARRRGRAPAPRSPGTRR